jgi:E3 ubiquitin-protein ligase HERC3
VGYGLDGRLGYGDKLNHGIAPEVGDNLPAISLGAGHTAQMLAGGSNHMCVVLEDSSIKCWGMNGNGQLGLGDTSLRGDEADEMGDNLPVISLGTGRTVQSMVGLNQHTCAILDDDTLKCWGWNGYGQLGQGNINHRGDSANEMGDNLPAISF